MRRKFLFRVNAPVYLFTWLLAFLANPSVHASEFISHWSGSRVWIGPAYWANPLQDWLVEKQEVLGLAAHNRTLHLLTHQVEDPGKAFQMEVQVRLHGSVQSDTEAEYCLGGFRFGLQGELDDYRHALIYAVEWIDAGIRGDGHLVVGNEVSRYALPIDQWITLKLRAEAKGERTSITLVGSAEKAGESQTVGTAVLSTRLKGNVALLADGSRQKPDRTTAAFWRFKDWRVGGPALRENKSQQWGPILWTQYTLSRKVLKLAALMAPVEGSNEPVRLELKKGRQWEEVAQSDVDPLSRTAFFRMENWDESQDVEYRVAYRWEGKDHTWAGIVRREPVDKSKITLGAFSCDNGYIFPNRRIVRNVQIQNPDLVFFAGDQIYESFGGFGITREPVSIAMLDYLRKYWMFGWSWREVLKDRPSVIITDDHDVFQGNIWGHGGRRIPNLGAKPSGSDWPKGGYAMHPDWVNAVQRTQTISLPDPVDPEPVEQGIDVYFTDMLYGGLDLAILEDRKFKTGPASVLGSQSGNSGGKDPRAIDVAEAELLGPRQEAFLKSWIQEEAGNFKVVLSQTIFCKVTTHVARDLRPSRTSTDTNGWPQNKRDRALEILGNEVVMLHGDQHLGALVHQGIDDWEDGPFAFMVPGTANGFPRAWWPDKPGEDRKPGEPEWTGRYFDGMGNRMTVLAAANPEKGSNLIPKGAQDPESIGHQKGSGHGIVRFDRSSKEVTFEMWRLQFDASNPQPEDQFDGFPKTVKLGR